MSLNLKDKVKEFMFLEDRLFRSQFKEDTLRESFREELRTEAFYRA